MGGDEFDDGDVSLYNNRHVVRDPRTPHGVREGAEDGSLVRVCRIWMTKSMSLAHLIPSEQSRYRERRRRVNAYPEGK
jgi:hypothetical protein